MKIPTNPDSLAEYSRYRTALVEYRSARKAFREARKELRASRIAVMRRKRSERPEKNVENQSPRP